MAAPVNPWPVWPPLAVPQVGPLPALVPPNLVYPHPPVIALRDPQPAPAEGMMLGAVATNSLGVNTDPHTFESVIRYGFPDDVRWRLVFVRDPFHNRLGQLYLLVRNAQNQFVPINANAPGGPPLFQPLWILEQAHLHPLGGAGWAQVLPRTDAAGLMCYRLDWTCEYWIAVQAQPVQGNEEEDLVQPLSLRHDNKGSDNTWYCNDLHLIPQIQSAVRGYT